MADERPATPVSVDPRQAFAGVPVLVAGADGFLGVNAVAALHAAGAVVTVLSRRDVPRAGALAARHVRADLRDADAVAAAVEGQAYVFDLAGTSGAVGSNADPGGSTDQDCRPHLTLFTAAAAAASRPVVAFCSSRLVYGRPDYLPVDEDHPVRPASFYAVHKLTLEHYLHVLATTRGLRSCVLRLSNPYGPFWPEQRKGYGLINQFIARALAGEPITIFGDGSQRRDYIHVDDVSAALLAVATADNCRGQTFNLGGAESVSIRAAVETIAAQIPTADVRFVPWPAEHLAVETGDYQSDLSKLQRHVRLPPQAAFAEGLRRTLRAVRQGLPRG
jgi:UDP-glucose 4-epimerase